MTKQRLAPAPTRFSRYDLGTTRIKVALFDLRGRLIGQRASRHQEQRHEGNRAWQDADAWWTDAVRLTQRVAHGQTAPRRRDLRFRPRRRRGVHRPRRHRHRPAVVRPPARRGTRARWSNGARSGAHLSNYAAALLAKKQWFAANEPTRARQLRHVLYAKDFLIYRLTGHAVTDRHERTGRAQLGCARARPHRQREPGAARRVAVGHRRTARSARGDKRSICPPASRSSSARTTASARTSAPARAIRAHTRSRSAPTRWFARYEATFRTASFRFYDLPPDRHVIGGNAVMGGRAADWFLDLVFGANDRSRARHFVAMDAAAADVPAGSGGVRFLPFLVGPGRTGIAPRRERGVHRPAHVARPLSRVSRRAGRRRVRDPLDLRSDPGVVRRTVDAPAHRQRRAQPRSGARFWPTRSGAPSRLPTRR